jgi:hypothetical protein
MRNVASVAELTKSFFAEIDKVEMVKKLVVPIALRTNLTPSAGS